MRKILLALTLILTSVVCFGQITSYRPVYSKNYIIQHQYLRANNGLWVPFTNSTTPTLNSTPDSAGNALQLLNNDMLAIRGVSGFITFPNSNQINSSVLTTALTGYTLGSNATISATDNILNAFGKVQAQINAKGAGTVTSFNFTNGNGITGSVSSSTTTPTLGLSIQNAGADGTTKGIATFNANDFDSSAGVIRIDMTNAPKATTSQNGILTSTDWNTFNGKQPQLNGTGFVKASGTSISYDNTTYITAADTATFIPKDWATGIYTINGARRFTGDITSQSAYIRLYNSSFSQNVNIPLNGGFSYNNTGADGDGGSFRANRIAATFGNPINGGKTTIYGTGYTASHPDGTDGSDGMGGIAVVRNTSGGNKAYYGYTRLGNVALATGISTAGDFIMGTGPNRGVTATIDSVILRINPTSGSFTLKNSTGTTLFDVSPSGNVTASGTISGANTGMYRLTGSGTGAATTISIPHGLAGVTSSSIAIVQPINAASAGVSYVTTDATNINIVYTVAPASGTNNLSYNVSIKP